MNNEERIMSLGLPVEDSDFVRLLRSRLHTLLKNITRNPEMFPGSQPVSFEKRHLRALEEEDYYVCEKSDGVRALDHLTLPTRDLKGFQEETLLDGELVWDDRRGELVYYIFDGIMFQAKNLTQFDLNGRLQVVQNDVIGPYQAREERKTKMKREDVSVYEATFPFKLKMKQMWKPYGLGELFERVIPSQGHENDGLIFTPVKDPYVAGTCHRLLKWKPSEMNSIDFLIMNISGDSSGGQLFMASHGRPCYYTDFDPKSDINLMKTRGIDDSSLSSLNGKIAEFRLDPSHPNKWTFMRFRPDKKLPNDTKTVEKVLQSIKDNVRREDLLEREAVIRSNWKFRESSGKEKSTSKVSESTVALLPRSQMIQPPVTFAYPLNLRTEAAKAAYREADGWLDSEIGEKEKEEDKEDEEDKDNEDINTNSHPQRKKLKTDETSK